MTFDPAIITYGSKIKDYLALLDVFFIIHDPTQSDGQGEDIGSQYLSAVFYLNE